MFYKIVKTDRDGEVAGVVPKVSFQNIEEALLSNFGVRLNSRVFKDKTTTIKRRCTTYQIDPLEGQNRKPPVKVRRNNTMPEKPDYSKITHADFIRLLSAEMDKEGKPSALLTIPQIYEIVCEHYNNAILEAWEKEQV